MRESGYIAGWAKTLSLNGFPSIPLFPSIIGVVEKQAHERRLAMGETRKIGAHAPARRKLGNAGKAHSALYLRFPQCIPHPVCHSHSSASEAHSR